MDYSACTWSVWEDTWCHTGGIREHCSVSEKTNDPALLATPKTSTHTSSIQRNKDRDPGVPQARHGLDLCGVVPVEM